MFWIILSIVLLVIGGISIYVLHKDLQHPHEYPEWIENTATAGTLIGLLVGVLILGGYTIGNLTYNEFEAAYEIQREYYKSFDFENNDFAVVEILDINKELTDYQVRRQMYGEWFSLIPERVLDIKPIGID